jgi:hypothetical protein
VCGLGSQVVVQLVLALKLEDEAVGHAFAERFPGAVLACTPQHFPINNSPSRNLIWGIGYGERVERRGEGYQLS